MENPGGERLPSSSSKRGPWSPERFRLANYGSRTHSTDFYPDLDPTQRRRWHFFHSSTLAWKIPWTEEPGRLQSMGSLKSRTRLSDLTFTFHFPALEKEMATHSSVLAWRIPGTGEPDGLLSMGSNRVGHDWSDFAVVVVAVQKLISFNRSHLFTSAFISIALENYLRNHCYNFC